MCVALIAHYLGPKLGVGQYFDRLIPPLVTELKNHQIPVKIIASPNSAEKTPALKENVYILPALDYSPNRRYSWLAMNFAKYCREEEVTLAVWLSNPMVLPWHPPAIAVIHDVNEWKAKNKYGSSWKTALRSLIYLDASLRFAKRLIVVSQGTERDLLHFRPQKRLQQKLRTIPNGTNSQLINLPPISITSPTAPFLLSVGRIDPEAKRLPEAIALVSQMREISGEEWEIHLVGGMNASTKQQGEEFLQAVEHLPWVHYHGYIDDRTLAQWYRQATAVIFLSENEGFGLPIAEAVAFGRWVITSRNNQTSSEAGGNAIIAVDIHDQSAATQILNSLKTELPANHNLPKWDAVAKAYADEINATLLSSKI